MFFKTLRLHSEIYMFSNRISQQIFLNYSELILKVTTQELVLSKLKKLDNTKRRDGK